MGADRRLAAPPPALHASPVVVDPPGTAFVPPAPDLRALSGDNALGRHVLVPRSLYPTYSCSEFDGDGWRAEVVRVTPRGVVVHFVLAHTSRGRPYADAELQLSALRPL